VRSYILKIICIMLLIALAVSSTALADNANEDKVVEIAFDGLKTITPQSLLDIIRTRAGDKYSTQAINEDVRLLTKSGYFEWVTVTAEKADKGLKITFRVSERILVVEILFLNNKSVTSNILAEGVGITAGQYLDYFLFNNSSDKIKEIYRNRGFAKVEVTHRMEPVKGGARLVWLINEGIRRRISKVIFKGNTSFSNFRLAMMISTKPYFIFLQPGTLKEEVLYEDLQTLTRFYHDEGYLDAKVTAEETATTNKSWILITFTIVQGPRYRVGTVRFDGNKVLSVEQLREAMNLKNGEFFTANRFRTDIEAIRNLYGDSGYIDLVISPDINYRKVEAVVDLTIRLTENEQIFVRRIDFAGNFKTRDNVIRRNIKLIPGQPFSRRQRQRSLRNLMSMGLFSSADVRDVKSPEKNFRDITFEVEETSTASIIFGGAISSNEGLFGTISFTQRNFDILDFPEGWDDVFDSFSGAGQTFRLEFRPGTEFSDLMLYFREPSILDSPYGLSFRARFVQRAREKWDEARAGVTVGISRRFWENWVGIASVRVENVEIDSIASDAPPDVFAVKGDNAIRSFEFVLDYDNTDSRFSPTEGIHVRGSWEIAAEALGGDWSFNRVNARAINFWPVYETRDGFKHVFSLSGEAGVVKAFGNSGFVPLFERYYAGGSNSVRGFGFRDLGPTVGGTPIGGEVLVLASAEYLIPLWSHHFRGVLFMDAGGVFPAPGDMDLADIRVSIGCGLRITVPALGPFPLSFDLGFPLNPQAGDETQIFSFNIRTNF